MALRNVFLKKSTDVYGVLLRHKQLLSPVIINVSHSKLSASLQSAEICRYYNGVNEWRRTRIRSGCSSVVDKNVCM